MAYCLDNNGPAIQDFPRRLFLWMMWLIKLVWLRYLALWLMWHLSLRIFQLRTLIRHWHLILWFMRHPFLLIMQLIQLVRLRYLVLWLIRHLFLRMIQLRTLIRHWHSSLMVDAVNTDLTLPLLPFLNTSLIFHFHWIIGIDFTYHPLLYHNHSVWIKFILPILQLLIFYFYFKYIFLFSHHDPDNPYSFAVLIPFVQSAIPLLHISTHLILPHNLGDNISCFRSLLYISPLPT